jgi:phage terminase large subunit GpA-like protein
MQRVIACKGMKTIRTLLGVPSAVDVTHRGKKLSRGYKVWPVSPDIAKAELYGWLRLRIEEGEEAPPGYCHFPEHPEEFFRQLTAEHLVTVRKRSGGTSLEWHVLPNRENHWLDARNYARAAAAMQGLDRMAPRARGKVVGAPPPARPTAAAPEAPVAEPRGKGAWLSKPNPTRPRGGGWLRNRR